MNPFLVNVDDIKVAAQPWEGDLSRENLDALLLADPPTEFHAGGVAHARARLTKMGRKVLVQSKFTVPLAGQCKRCLKPVALDEPVEVTLTYVPAPSPPSRKHSHDAAEGGAHAAPREGAEAHRRGDRDSDHKPVHEAHEAAGSFAPETADEEIYPGKSIDLGPALREAILLAVPPSPLCSETCLGLCLNCGQDLNERDCGHSQQVGDLRWESLKKLKLEGQQDLKQEPKKE